MSTKFSRRAVALLAVLWAAPAAGQDVLHYSAGDQQAGVSIVAFDPVSIGAPVTNAPYSAEAVTEVTQSLADGNRIERRTSSTIARASDGRTRREQQGFAVGTFVGQSAQPIVTITDPKTGVHITLNYDLKVAHRMKPSWVAAQRVEGGAAATWTMGPLESKSSGMVIQGRGTAVAGRRMPPPPPPLPGGPEIAFEAPVAMSEPVAVMSGAMMPWGGDVKTETLEPRTIEGLKVEGTRVTMTLPAGAVGNVLPIETIRERWFSPELQVVVMTRSSDPRFGETVYRLTNIVRTEPSPDLFKVPSDFRIEDGRP